MTTKTISADFPFESKYIEIEGSKMHYIDEGEGDPILFLHGNPTSSYLWRNVIPHLTPHGRCIAVDLIGMGKSDKPDIEYRFFDHAKYLEGFIKKLELTNITLVIHDWGSGLGFHYAMRHESNIKGIAFMEAMMKEFTWESFPGSAKTAIKMLRTPGLNWLMGGVMNIFLKQMLPQMIVRKLSAEEKAYYQEPYKTLKSRKPVRQWPLEIPVNGQPADTHKMLTSYSQKLQQSELPKLLLFANPGTATDDKMLAWCKQNLKNLKTVDVGEGFHFIQEDNPDMIGKEIAKWHQGL